VNGFLLGLLQQAPWGLAVIAIVWIRISSLERRVDGMDKRVDKLENRVNDVLNHGRK